MSLTSNHKLIHWLIISISSTFLFSYPALASEINIAVNQINSNGVGAEIGTITAKDSEYGLILTPNLTDLPPGIHGFHLHEKASCDPGTKDGKMAAGIGAGGHFDPSDTEMHQGPYADGHLGDLPPLIVDRSGNATLPVLAPRLKTADLSQHAIIIHQGEDNYSDLPQSLGGGGGRIACGMIR